MKRRQKRLDRINQIQNRLLTFKYIFSRIVSVTIEFKQMKRTKAACYVISIRFELNGILPYTSQLK